MFKGTSIMKKNQNINGNTNQDQKAYRREKGSRDIRNQNGSDVKGSWGSISPHILIVAQKAHQLIGCLAAIKKCWRLKAALTTPLFMDICL